LIGRELQFGLLGLVGFMAVLIFLPLLASVFFRRLLPRISGWLDEHSYPISLVLLAAMNLGALGLYTPFLRAHHTDVVISVLVIVLGNYFNDPLISVLAALYTVPYYVLIVPLGHLSRGLERSGD
jgi:hypothetical protein